jgi:hypothetical protein
MPAAAAAAEADGLVSVDARGRQHGVGHAAVATNVWVHVSGLDRFVEAGETAALLRTALLRCCDTRALRCDVAGFADDFAPPFKERRRRDQGKCHQGWALVLCEDERTAEKAASALQARLRHRRRTAVAALTGRNAGAASWRRNALSRAGQVAGSAVSRRASSS